jgi:hypothetical protein
LLALFGVLELGVQVGIDAQRLRLLIVLNLRRALSLLRMLLLAHAHERRSVVIVAAHDVSSWGEHALNLTILVAHHLVSALWVYRLSLTP